MLKTCDLYDLTHTLAAEYLAGYEYPWQALKGIKDLILTLGSYATLIIALVRCFSRNTYKRYQENRRFLLLMDRIKDRNNRYYSCPKCRQTVRVPKGKGKIAITCPKCREKFIKKT